MSQKKAMKKQEEEEEEGVDGEGFHEFITKARYELLEGIQSNNYIASYWRPI